MNGKPINEIEILNDKPNEKVQDISVTSVSVKKLDIEDPWGIYFKAPVLYEKLKKHELLVPIEQIARTRIGIQTLAKDFFALSPEKVKLKKIEEEFLEPLAHSAAYFDTPKIDSDCPVKLFLFYCSKTRDKLQGTKALEYIKAGEQEEVEIRGKDIKVKGYNNKPRIKKANRANWYDIETSVKKRGRAPILIPRLIYRKYGVFWNKEEFVPGGAFIEFLPKDANIDVQVYLSVLNSTLAEIMFRLDAQVYGGGTYNIGLRQVKRTFTLDIKKLTTHQKSSLINSYQHYLEDQVTGRLQIDCIICEILGFDASMQTTLNNVLEDLHLIAVSANKNIQDSHLRQTILDKEQSKHFQK